MSNEQKLREALQAYIDAGFGNSTDPHKQGAAYDLAIEALALPTADHLPDARVMIEAAAPVGERDLFERWAKDNAIRTDLGAWEAWQARAALSAGDAVDARRYRWLMDNCTLGIKQNGVGWILNTSACVAPDCIKDVGAAIDAAMRKGQL